eukprot:192703_1
MTLLLFSIIVNVVVCLKCKDRGGVDTDWWFIFRLAGVAKDYAYYDVNTAGDLQIVGTAIDHTDSPLRRTLDPLYTTNNINVNYVAYNDKPPGYGNVPKQYAHAKGVFAFDSQPPANPGDSNTGFWLIHSQPWWPKFDDRNVDHLEYCNQDPDVSLFRWCSLEYSQSFLCVSFEHNNNADDRLRNIINQVASMRPMVYTSHTTDHMHIPGEFAQLRHIRMNTPSALQNIITAQDRHILRNVGRHVHA